MIRNQRGNALLLVLVVFATLFALLSMSFDRGEQLLRRLQHQSLEQVALNLAEAGVEYTLHQLALPGNDIEKTTDIDLDTGSFSTSVSYFSSGRFEIMATGKAKNGHRMEETVIKTLKVQGRFSPDEPDAVPVVTIWEEVL
ncbi:type II secretory pathway [Candidatus Vecturithrix granuli]|uniref:Type II secretory pathway n=1 Tax=Vecturithrix granuli TaxID=1499967 RepID=A0A0S6W9V9_VECG1|nr:type II secretory pathway [Candidatus Vecturithrix granuli]